MSDTYLVIENTPGYVPDAEPAEFDSYTNAVAYANELLDELEDEGYTTNRGWASRDNFFAGMATTDERSHDLGRSVEVVRAEEE